MLTLSHLHQLFSVETCHTYIHYPCLAMERSPTAMSPLLQPRRRPVGLLPRQAGMQTLPHSTEFSGAEFPPRTDTLPRSGFAG
jgi:hypothetical protein